MVSMPTRPVIIGAVIVLCVLALLANLYNSPPVDNDRLGQWEVLQLVSASADLSGGEWDDPNNALTRGVLKKLDHSVCDYLKLLGESVAIVEIPFAETPSVYRAKRECSASGKRAFVNNQHSLEMRFPYALKQMQAAGIRSNRPELRLLWQNTSAQHTEPLFYYLQSLQYYVVHCSYSSRGKESWNRGEQYLEEITKYVVDQLPEFDHNKGVDFLVPASHPKSGPFVMNPYTVGNYQRQTFLRTDLDFNGNVPKDIIVPYYVPWRTTHTLPNISTSTGGGNSSDNHPRNGRGNTGATGSGPAHGPHNLLLFFAGGKNPVGGLREELEAQVTRLQRQDSSVAKDVLFTTKPIPPATFERGLHSSTFCAHVRGDTASSSRLFQIIEAGCIPVVISDWLMLPYERVIDYSKFTLRFPESVVHDVGSMIAHLRSIPADRIVRMQQAVHAVRGMVLFPPWQQGHVPVPASAGLHTLNPVTLTLIEMFIRRKEYCDALDGVKRATGSTAKHSAAGKSGTAAAVTEDKGGSHRKGDMCAKIYARLASLSRSR